MGCEGTLATWDLATVLGRISQDIPGYSEAVHYIFVYLGQLGKSVAVLDIYGPGNEASFSVMSIQEVECLQVSIILAYCSNQERIRTGG